MSSKYPELVNNPEVVAVGMKVVEIVPGVEDVKGLVTAINADGSLSIRFTPRRSAVPSITVIHPVGDGTYSRFPGEYCARTLFIK